MKWRNKKTGTVYAAVEFNDTPIATVTTDAGATFTVKRSQLEPVEPTSEAQVLANAIDKAIDNGYPFDKIDWRVEQVADQPILFLADQSIHPYAIMYDQDFLKHLWGDEDFKIDYFDGDTHQSHIAAWKFHGQQMLVTENPYDYLRENTPK